MSCAPPPCCATCGENPHTVRPCQVQQLEKGLPGRLKVVAKSTEGTETMEGVYNTVSVCRASRLDGHAGELAQMKHVGR